LFSFTFLSPPIKRSSTEFINNPEKIFALMELSAAAKGLETGEYNRTGQHSTLFPAIFKGMHGKHSPQRHREHRGGTEKTNYVGGTLIGLITGKWGH
jgi:hypothetical protein